MNAAPPERLGPYRLEGRLGRGGMGEVYRAFDERLERPVAVKLIRPEAAGDARARERFRREARAAASLNHPAIVQIHDIVETPLGDAIVMELVAGQTLASLLAAGPLDLPRALRLGIEVAEGLAAAHARGLIHRDLKPENVMVTEAGHAKILDFGLAKRTLSAAGETSLSLDGTVLGTYRSMSPEQARGLSLDGRSDLFSFGSLLYEALTGESPFAAGTVLETLTNLCTVRQRPAAELRPAIPPALSDLLDRLLEKDPARRPASAAEVASALADLAGWPPSSARSSPFSGVAGVGGVADELPTLVEGRPLTLPSPTVAVPSHRTTSALSRPRRGWRWEWAALLLAVAVLGPLAWLRSQRDAGARLYVAVTRPELGRGADLAGVDLLASGLRVALLRGLLGIAGVTPLAPEQVDPVPGPPRTVARATAADEVVTSRLDCALATCRVSLSRVLGRDGSLLWTQSFEAPAGDPYELAGVVEAYLRQGYPERGQRQAFSRLEVQPRDYEEYLNLRHGLEAKDPSLSLDRIVERLEAIRRSSPRFLEATVLEAGVLKHRFSSRREPADLEKAFDLLAGARQLAPSDPRPWLELFDVAFTGERLDQAEAALAELERLQPGDSGVLVQRARLLERRGSTREALALMREAARRRPAWNQLARLGDMEYRLGESDAARRHLEEGLRRFPEQHAGRSLLAQIELLSGSPERAVALYSELVARSPQVTELINLGLAHLLLGHYAEAEKRFAAAVEREPKSFLANLNLADARLLKGDRSGAEALYQHVIELTREDPAASHWQPVSARAQALAHLGQRLPAVEAAQQVLLLAHDNAQAVQEVSLVYVLVGDLSSARLNAGRSLALGVEPRWFDFPWYAPLRASPEFQDLLKRHARRPLRPER